MQITIEATAEEIDAWTDGLASMIAAKLKGAVQAMSGSLNTLAAQVHHNSDVVQSAIVLINGISDRIKAAGADPAALQALTQELDTQDQALAAAVAANTPAVDGGTSTVTGGGTSTVTGGVGDTVSGGMGDTTSGGQGTVTGGA